MSKHYDVNPDGDVLLICFQAIEKGSPSTAGSDATVLLQDENSQEILAEDSIVRETSTFYDTSTEGHMEPENNDSRLEESIKDVRISSLSRVDPLCSEANSV